MRRTREVIFGGTGQSGDDLARDPIGCEQRNGKDTYSAMQSGDRLVDPAICSAICRS